MKYFDKYDLELPTNYDELKAVCQTFRDNGEYPRNRSKRFLDQH